MVENNEKMFETTDQLRIELVLMVINDNDKPYIILLALPLRRLTITTIVIESGLIIIMVDDATVFTWLIHDVDS